MRTKTRATRVPRAHYSTRHLWGVGISGEFQDILTALNMAVTLFADCSEFIWNRAAVLDLLVLSLIRYGSN